MKAAAGNVITQAMAMPRATPQRTAEILRAAPTPLTAPVTVWVVETGIPSQVAPNNAAAPPASAQNPWVGRRSVMRDPTVRTMRQPPINVPPAIAA